ncbi:hypothetical protein [Weissella confusa]|uniref:hypothetical protein n=1 Tax=Weissella confusa TaxID=1583 RepID=UPI0018F2116B|nr:hypothetical protein [Weissella confusa]MBJ7616871.1 hypothetical protein [Weissella confusa]MBJ7627099.1 hypothetical protein [Weissella confusa]
MSISNNDKDKARDYIEAKHSNGVSWDDLKKVNFHPFSKFVPQEGIERFNCSYARFTDRFFSAL